MRLLSVSNTKIADLDIGGRWSWEKQITEGDERSPSKLLQLANYGLRVPGKPGLELGKTPYKSFASPDRSIAQRSTSGFTSTRTGSARGRPILLHSYSP